MAKWENKLHRMNQLFAGLNPAFNAKAQDGPLTFRQIFLRQCIGSVALESGIAYPLDGFVVFKESGDGKGVLAVPLQTEMQRFRALQQQERVERRQCGAKIPQQLDARFNNIS